MPRTASLIAAAPLALGALVTTGACGSSGNGSTGAMSDASTDEAAAIPVDGSTPTDGTSTHDSAPGEDGAGDAGPAPVTWVPVGPIYPNGDSGKMVTLARDPANPMTMLIGGDNGGPGIYRSIDGGKTWKVANQGLTTTDGLVDSMLRQIWFVPGASSVVLAVAEHGVYRSTDDGQTWANVYRNVQDFADGIDLLATRGTDTLCATSDGLLSSIDQGKTWAMDWPHGASNVVTEGGLTLVTGNDDTVQSWTGSAWHMLTTLPADIHQIAVDPKSPSVVYAAIANGSYNYNLYGSTDGATTFQSIAYPSNLLGTQSIAFSASFAHRLYVAGDGSAVYITADGNVAPTTTSVPFGVDTRHLYVEASGADDRCWFADDQGAHVIQSCAGTGGAQLTGFGATLETNLVTGFAVSRDGQNLVALIQDFSAASTQSGGAMWKGLSAISEDGAGAFSPTDSLRCYAFSDAWYVSSDGCKTVTKKAALSGPTYQGQTIAFDPANAMHMWVVDGGGGVYSSTDGGDTLTPTTWPFTKADLVVVDPASGKHLFVHDGTMGLQMSQDGGSTWHASTGVSGLGSVAVAVDPADGQTVLAMGSASGVLKILASTDGGVSFSPRYSLPGGEPAGLAFNQVTTGTPLVAFTTMYEGAYLSIDLGTKWSRIDSQLITHKYTAAQWVSGTLYLSTYGQGVLKSSRPLQ